MTGNRKCGIIIVKSLFRLNIMDKKLKDRKMTNEELYQLMKDGFDQVNQRFNEVNQRLDRMDQRLDGMDTRLRTVENGISELKGSKARLRGCGVG